MKQSWMTLQERQIILLLRWWVGLFAATAIVFAIFPNEVIYWINTIGLVIFRWPHKLLPAPSEHFWQILSVSLLIVLAVVAYLAQHDIRENLSYVKLIIISKLATVTGFVMAFVLDGAYFAYLAGFVADLIIFLLTWFCYRRTRSSRAL